MENISTSISLPKELDQRLKNLAKKRGQTKNGFIQSALWDYIDRIEIETIEKKMQAQARLMGIQSDEDVVELVHQVRSHGKKH